VGSNLILFKIEAEPRCLHRLWRAHLGIERA
jgi:hypothetical protein